jgi:DNA-binding PadR family transcriptional regulator
MALAEDAARWSHGYDLCRRLGFQAGTVYPILMRLAERDLVETTWEQEPPQGRPARHLYRLSALGAEFVDDHRLAARGTAEVERVAGAVRVTPRRVAG